MVSSAVLLIDALTPCFLSQGGRSHRMKDAPITMDAEVAS